MASATASKVLLTATADFLSSSSCSLSHRRALTVSASLYPRIAPFPQDLVGWVKREGGFVHPKLRIADRGEYGLTLVASEDIPRGSRLVALPERLTLRLRWSQDGDGADRPDSPLSQLVHRVPGDFLSLIVCFHRCLMMSGFRLKAQSWTTLSCDDKSHEDM